MFLFVCLVIFNATFNNISVISWRSALLVSRKPEYQEKTADLLQVTDNLSHNVVHLTLIQIRTHNISRSYNVIGLQLGYCTEI